MNGGAERMQLAYDRPMAPDLKWRAFDRIKALRSRKFHGKDVNRAALVAFGV